MKFAGPPAVWKTLWWIAPSLACLWLYWLGLRCWFQADDFAWLKFAREVHSFSDLGWFLFMPKAQGTIRPFSERAIFLVMDQLFGLDARPFRALLFLTQFANLALIAAITLRLTASRLAGILAPLFWIANSSQPQIMTWTAVYNEAMCGFFLLLAFWLLLRDEWRWQWVVFLLGFGALELNVVYPAIAALYCLLCRRDRLVRTLPMIAVSVVYAAVHKWAAPGVASGVYAMHFDGSIVKTVARYWSWTMGPAWLDTIYPQAPWVIWGATAALTAALLGYAFYKRGVALFLLGWFCLLLAPVAPLRDHPTEYYPFLPAIGLAILAAMAFAQARLWVAVPLAAIYFGFSIPAVQAGTEYMFKNSRAVRELVLAVEEAGQKHPTKTILLDGISETLFWAGLNNHPFPLVVKQNVYMTPGSETMLAAHPEWGNIDEFVLAPAATLKALERNEVVVYDTRGPRLRNITGLYASRAAATLKPEAPRRVDVSNPLMADYLDKGWHRIEENHRWMSKHATVKLAGPRTAAEKLYLTGNCPILPVNVTVSVEGVKLGKVAVAARECSFQFGLPAGVLGKAEMVVTIEGDNAIKPPDDGRELSLVFGVIEVR